jgi:hypothetical protein
MVVDERDTFCLNQPSVHDLHDGSVVVLPIVSVKFPRPHRVCNVHVSVARDVLDGVGLNCPSAHTLHTVSEVVVPVELV